MTLTIRDIVTDQDGASVIVETIVSMADSLGLEVIAEGKIRVVNSITLALSIARDVKVNSLIGQLITRGS
jgi:hypothetical protein